MRGKEWEERSEGGREGEKEGVEGWKDKQPQIGG